MERLLAVWLASSLFFLLLYRSKVRVCIGYRRKSADDQMVVDVYLLQKLLVYHMEIPIIRIIERGSLPWLESEVETGKGDVETHSEREQTFIRNTMDIYLHHPAKWRQLMTEVHYYTKLYTKFMRGVLAKTACERFWWKTRFGSGDAAVTAVSVGMLWALKNLVLTRLRGEMPFTSRPVLAVVPDFKRTCFEAEFECILSFRLGNVMNATLSLIEFPRRKGAKGSERASDQ